MATQTHELIERAPAAANERQGSQRLQRREGLDRLVRLAEHLPPEERALVVGVYEAGLSNAQVARLAGATSRTIRRRLRRIERRVRDPSFTFVLAHRADWSDERRRVAEARWLRGHSIRQITRATGISHHHVRRHIDAVRAQLEVIHP